MAEALYGPDGYYERRPRLGGPDADFFTSPELHPVFGALLGIFAARVWSALGRPSRFEIVEYGPGTGALCRDLLTWADHDAASFGRAIQYRLVEASDALRAVQRATLSSAGLLSGRVSWAEAPSSNHAKSAPKGFLEARLRPPRPPPPFEGEGESGGAVGLILANELVDALPVHVVALRDGRLVERYVVLDGDSLGWQEDTPSTPALPAYFDRLGLWPGEGCQAEVNLAGVAWTERAASGLDRGALLVLDYGYPAADLYGPDRRHGTLLTYRGHTLGSDPLRHVGAQDITAHVDFTSLARAGERGGLDTVGLISQAALLRRLGIEAYLQRLDRSSVRATEHDANRRALLALVEPTGLGRIQALLQTRGLPSFDPFAFTDDARSGAQAGGTAAGDAWLPVLRAGQMRLPGPLEAEGFLDLDSQWQELLGGVDDVRP
jgi:SAM-dependent MidA family methyltransferase